LNLSTFVHSDDDSPTTLSEIERIHGSVETEDFFGVYAYATLSGASSFDLILGEDFWNNTASRWLFGVDYGRTQPQALKYISEKPNTEVRIFDGCWIIDKDGFIPRRDFHAKMSLLLTPSSHKYGMVVGSGNFSSNGLRNSVEAGAAIHTEDVNMYGDSIQPSVNVADSLWRKATPVASILDIYEEKWHASYPRETTASSSQDTTDYVSGDVFWIEAGYVTKNRGPDRPGNQIDFPRGMSRYFGFNPPDDLDPNTVIGNITFKTSVGDAVSNNLRLGNNMMEKISLPMPETHGFDIYDGKVLVFRKSDNRFVMHALEADDFEKVFGSKLTTVKSMNSGRRYGHIR